MQGGPPIPLIPAVPAPRSGFRCNHRGEHGEGTGLTTGSPGRRLAPEAGKGPGPDGKDPDMTHQQVLRMREIAQWLQADAQDVAEGAVDVAEFDTAAEDLTSMADSEEAQ